MQQRSALVFQRLSDDLVRREMDVAQRMQQLLRPSPVVAGPVGSARRGSDASVSSVDESRRRHRRRAGSGDGVPGRPRRPSWASSDDSQPPPSAGRTGPELEPDAAAPLVEHLVSVVLGNREGSSRSRSSAPAPADTAVQRRPQPRATHRRSPVTFAPVRGIAPQPPPPQSSPGDVAAPTSSPTFSSSSSSPSTSSSSPPPQCGLPPSASSPIATTSLGHAAASVSASPTGVQPSAEPGAVLDAHEMAGQSGTKRRFASPVAAAAAAAVKSLFQPGAADDALGAVPPPSEPKPHAVHDGDALEPHVAQQVLSALHRKDAEIASLTRALKQMTRERDDILNELRNTREEKAALLQQYREQLASREASPAAAGGVVIGRETSPGEAESAREALRRQELQYQHLVERHEADRQHLSDELRARDACVSLQMSALVEQEQALQAVREELRGCREQLLGRDAAVARAEGELERWQRAHLCRTASAAADVQGLWAQLEAAYRALLAEQERHQWERMLAPHRQAVQRDAESQRTRDTVAALELELQRCRVHASHEVEAHRRTAAALDKAQRRLEQQRAAQATVRDADVAALENLQRAHEEATADLRRQLEELRQELEKQVAKYRKTKATAQQWIEAFESTRASQAEAEARHAIAIEELQTRHRNTEQRGVELAAVVEAQSAALAAYRDERETLSGESGAYEGRIGVLKETVNGLRAAQTHLEEQLRAVEAERDAARGELALCIATTRDELLAQQRLSTDATRVHLQQVAEVRAELRRAVERYEEEVAQRRLAEAAAATLERAKADLEEAMRAVRHDADGAHATVARLQTSLADASHRAAQLEEGHARLAQRVEVVQAALLASEGKVAQLASASEAKEAVLLDSEKVIRDLMEVRDAVLPAVRRELEAAQHRQAALTTQLAAKQAAVRALQEEKKARQPSTRSASTAPPRSPPPSSCATGSSGAVVGGDGVDAPAPRGALPCPAARAAAERRGREAVVAAVAAVRQEEMRERERLLRAEQLRHQKATAAAVDRVRQETCDQVRHRVERVAADLSVAVRCAAAARCPRPSPARRRGPRREDPGRTRRPGAVAPSACAPTAPYGSGFLTECDAVAGLLGFASYQALLAPGEPDDDDDDDDDPNDEDVGPEGVAVEAVRATVRSDLFTAFLRELLHRRLCADLLQGLHRAVAAGAADAPGASDHRTAAPSAVEALLLRCRDAATTAVEALLLRCRDAATTAELLGGVVFALAQ